MKQNCNGIGMAALFTTALLAGCKQGKTPSNVADTQTIETGTSAALKSKEGNHLIEFVPNSILTNDGRFCEPLLGFANVAVTDDASQVAAQVPTMWGGMLFMQMMANRNGTLEQSYSPNLGNWGLADPVVEADPINVIELFESSPSTLSQGTFEDPVYNLPNPIDLDDLQASRELEINGNILTGGQWRGPIAGTNIDCDGQWKLVDELESVDLAAPGQYKIHFDTAKHVSAEGHACNDFVGYGSIYESDFKMVDLEVQLQENTTIDFQEINLSSLRIYGASTGTSLLPNDMQTFVSGDLPVLTASLEASQFALKGDFKIGGVWSDGKGCFGSWAPEEL